jgi:hypothetical protein
MRPEGGPISIYPYKDEVGAILAPLVQAGAIDLYQSVRVGVLRFDLLIA